jgi:hypothetical protein
MKLRQSRPSSAPFLFAILLAISASLSGCGDDDAADLDGSTPVVDAGGPDAIPSDADVRVKLSTQGLYTDIASQTVSPDAVLYAPSYTLWADGAGKRRWIIVPPDTQIDTSDMDHWDFPVGTKLFKEFATEDGKLLETRLIEKNADGSYFMGAFVWLEDGSDAILKLNGQQNVLGTTHDVPSKTRCEACHKGEAGRILGFSALQLSKDPSSATDVTLKSLAAAGLLTVNPPANTDYRFPGDATTKAALGYLHANCGHCHNPEGTAHLDTCLQDPRTHVTTDCMLLRLSIAEANAADPLQSGMVQSLIGHITHSNNFEGDVRVTAGDHTMSAIWVRASLRGGLVQMPPGFATEQQDETGLAAIAAWIDALN